MSKRILLFVCCTFFSIITFAQRQVNGKVTDADGKALSGVNVTVRNTKNTVQTDAAGNFKITTPEKGTLVFTSVGFVSQTVALPGDNSVNVTLVQSVRTEDDVVVIGYQTVRRKDLLASVASVGAKELKDVPVNSAAEALNGRLAGVTATTAEGSPDAEVRIRVRGGMSITGDNTPLYVIDGVQMENALSSISPQDILSIDVLKDAAATAIYGARGANGVVIITTKSGRTGKTKITLNSFAGVKTLAKKLNVLDPYDFVFFQSERSRGSNSDSSSFVDNYGHTWDTLNVYKSIPSINWQEETFGRTGFLTSTNLGVSGGKNSLTWSAGYTYNKEKAIVLNSDYNRHLANIKADYKFSKNIKLGGSYRYTYQDVVGAGVSDDKGSAYNRLRNAVKYRPFLSAGQDIDDPDPLQDPTVGNGLVLTNPIQLAEAEYRRKSNYTSNITGSFSYNFLKNFNFRSTVGYIKSERRDRQFYDSIAPYAIIQNGTKPIARLDTTNYTTLTNSNVLLYTLNNWRKKHDFTFLVGEETYDFKTEAYQNLYKDYSKYTSYQDAFKMAATVGQFAGYPKVGKSRYTNLSFFSRLNYGYLDRYLVSLNIRRDGASKFSEDNRWGTFPSASFAWRASKEEFMKNASFINDLKFRFGIGQNGNNRIDDYLYLTTFSNNGNYYYGLNDQTIISYYSTSLVNTQLKWESNVSKNFGIDLVMFKNRVSLTMDIYKSNSKDLLLKVPVASTYGYSTQFQNIGKTENKGIEVQLNTAILQNSRGLNWNANLNFAHNTNKIKGLGVNQNYFFADPAWGVSGQPADYIQQIGSPVGSMYGLVTDGFYTVNDFNYDPATSIYTLKPGVVNNAPIIGVVQPGSIKFQDLNGDSLVDLDNDRRIIGNPTPKFTGGFLNQFGYKNWDASFFLNFSYGNDIYNANKIEFSNAYSNNANLLDIMANRWKVVTPSGQTAQWVNGNNAYGIAPDQITALNSGATIWQPIRTAGAFYPHSWAIEDGSFLRINNITIGYSLPTKSVLNGKVDKLRFYVTGNNLAVFTNYSGYDPEVSVRNSPLTPGLDYSAYPKSRSFIFGLNATF